jgi:hypothetical protein
MFLFVGLRKMVSTVYPWVDRDANAAETSDCGSMSMMRVRKPLAYAAEASPRVMVVFPTPPLRELTLTTCTVTTLAVN